MAAFAVTTEEEKVGLSYAVRAISKISRSRWKVNLAHRSGAKSYDWARRLDQQAEFESVPNLIDFRILIRVESRAAGL